MPRILRVAFSIRGPLELEAIKFPLPFRFRFRWGVLFSFSSLSSHDDDRVSGTTKMIQFLHQLNSISALPIQLCLDHSLLASVSGGAIWSSESGTCFVS